MNKLPVDPPESFAYAVPGAGKAFHLEKDFFAFGGKYGTLDLWLKLTEESRHTYTDEEILIECKKRLKLPVVIRWQREIFDNLFFTLRINFSDNSLKYRIMEVIKCLLKICAVKKKNILRLWKLQKHWA